jgi:hypothetical protein
MHSPYARQSAAVFKRASLPQPPVERQSDSGRARFEKAVFHAVFPEIRARRIEACSAAARFFKENSVTRGYGVKCLSGDRTRHGDRRPGRVFPPRRARRHDARRDDFTFFST